MSAVMDLCDQWDSFSKGSSPTTTAVRRAYLQDVQAVHHCGMLIFVHGTDVMDGICEASENEAFGDWIDDYRAERVLIDITARVLCPTQDCPGDARYAAPGHGHWTHCNYPRP